jgi:hypothetical protein
VQANAFVRTRTKGVVLILLALTPIRVKRIGVSKNTIISICDKAGHHNIIASSKGHTVKDGVTLTNAIQINKGMHTQQFVNRVSNG